MIRIGVYWCTIILLLCSLQPQAQVGLAKKKPNIIVIYTDDVGFGDISANGATAIKTPAIDKIAKQGLRFTQAYATAATCTPSRYSLLTGQYAWRREGTSIAPGNAALIIPPQVLTLPALLQKAGYTTAVVGKWHLGLGDSSGPNWNGIIQPGPSEIGFTYSFILPATGDRVPCVYIENNKVVNADAADPISVDYNKKIGTDHTGAEQPALLKMKPSHGHDNTIVNGVSRIGWMSGGQKARWVDEDMAAVLAAKANAFIQSNKDRPFFLYFATHDIHVPRMPHARFVGKSGMGPRGDALLQLDYTVASITQKLRDLKIEDNTLLIFTSDNGPVIDDGYCDDAVAQLHGHTPSGIYRGGKYSAFEAGTRIPLMVRWPAVVKAGQVSTAAFSQIDFFASLAALTGQQIPPPFAPDSYNRLPALLGKSRKARPYIVQQAANNTLSLIVNQWKYIPPSKGPAISAYTNIELGNLAEPQLYNLSIDVGERNNLAATYTHKVKEMAAQLQSIKNKK